MAINKVVVRFKDGMIMKGQTSNFFPNKTLFHLETTNGEQTQINIEDLKAVFFVRDLEGDKDHVKSYKDNIVGGGRKIEVKFVDGEKLIGYTLGYSPDRQGFIMTPGDLAGNNERVFVIKSATEKINFL
jgi:hypothetical protein